MSVNRTSLGKRISFYRSKSTLTQEALAAKVNCSREYIVQIENGTKVPSLSVLVEIANTLSVSADELLLDCLEHSSSSANSEFHRLLLDCNETEQTVIIRIFIETREFTSTATPSASAPVAVFTIFLVSTTSVRLF